MAKRIFRILDSLSPSEAKLINIARKADGLNNCFFNEYGQLVKRKGFVQYNTTSLGSGRICGLHRFYKQDTDTKEFLCVYGQKWYTIPTSANHVPVALYSTGTTDFTTTSDMDTFFINYYDHCYGVNSKGLWKYGGSFVRVVGITVPIAPVWDSFQTNGELGTGDYYFKVTYVDEDDNESNGGAVNATVMTTTGADNAITITIPTSDDAHVPAVGGKRRIYRTAVNGAIFYYDDEVDDNSTPTFKSIKADSALGTVLHTNHTAPPTTPHLITKRRSRVILANNDLFYWSHAADPEYFPATWIIYTNARQKITGIMEQKEYMPVYTEDTIERLVGSDEDNFEFKNTYSGEGNIALRSLVSCNNLHLYLGVDGIYYFNGIESKIINKPLSEYIKDNINEAKAYLSAAVFFDNKYLLSYPKDDSDTNDETVYIDFETGTTGIYDFGFGCYCKWDRGTDGLQLYSGSATEGIVYKTLSGLEDDTAAITCYDRTEPIDLGKPDIYKQWYDIYIKIKTTTGTALTMYYTLDDEDETSKSLTMTADTTKWYRIRLAQGGQRARSIKIRPYISDKYDITIMGYALCYEEEKAEWLN